MRAFGALLLVCNVQKAIHCAAFYSVLGYIILGPSDLARQGLFVFFEKPHLPHLHNELTAATPGRPFEAT